MVVRSDFSKPADAFGVKTIAAIITLKNDGNETRDVWPSVVKTKKKNNPANDDDARNTLYAHIIISKPWGVSAARLMRRSEVGG